MELYKEDLRHFLREEYCKARENGFQNIEIVNDYMNGLPVSPPQFYKLCFDLAKEELEYPYVMHQLFERGSTVVVLIQFIHNIGQIKIEKSVSFQHKQE